MRKKGAGHRDVHPLEEAQGFKALLNLEGPKYSIEQIAAKVGKAPAYCAARVRLTELAASVIEAFYAEEIGVGHANDQGGHALDEPLSIEGVGEGACSAATATPTLQAGFYLTAPHWAPTGSPALP
jgi:hypothetical protein